MKMKVAQMAAQRVETMGCVDGMVGGCRVSKKLTSEGKVKVDDIGQS